MWNDKSVRYSKWKDYVIKCSCLKQDFDLKKRKLLKPIKIPSGYKAFMETKQYFANEAHADPDNIHKGIADALFQNDKKLAGTFNFWISPEKKGLVEVTIDFIKII